MITILIWAGSKPAATILDRAHDIFARCSEQWSVETTATGEGKRLRITASAKSIRLILKSIAKDVINRPVFYIGMIFSYKLKTYYKISDLLEVLGLEEDGQCGEANTTYA